MTALYLELDAHALLERVAAKVPAALRGNVVVVGSIATAWAFRDVSGSGSVATKDIDLLLRPAVDAVATAQTLGQRLLDEGWEPRFPHGRAPGTMTTPIDELPALRLTPPGGEDGWFVELLAAPPTDQLQRKHWSRFTTPAGIFGLPSFRYMPVAVWDADETPFGLRVAKPACMAMAHLLEHASPDTTPISGLPGQPARFIKDVGRAVALWWLASQQSVKAAQTWRRDWDSALNAFLPERRRELSDAANTGLRSLSSYLRDAHEIAVAGVLAPHGTTLEAYRRAYEALLNLLDDQ